jgi:GntR family transcriptional regulator/MocR family aminotransferase
MAKRPARIALIGVGLDPYSAAPRHRQLYDALRAAILAGRLAPGARLPSSRTLAAEVGCSRNTVLAAFEQLSAEGYLNGKVGSGTTVAVTPPDSALRVPTAPRAPRAAPGRRALPARRGARLATVHVVQHGVTGSRPFRPGVPALDEFPSSIWSRLVARWTRAAPRSLLEYGPAAGYPPLREAIAVYLREARGVHCAVEQVIIVSGSQQGIDLTARVVLEPGDSVWLEDPGYPSARAALAAAGMRVCPVPVDAEGLDVADGARRAPQARLAYVTPSHQFPLGVTMSLARRLALLEWARRSGGWILEDDHDSEYRYASRPLAAVQGLDRTGCVIYLGTFSKVLFPALRLGYLVVPPSLVDAFTAARDLVDRHSPSLTQAALADFIADGHFARHIRRHRTLYAARQAALVAAARRVAGALDVAPADAGMHLVGWLPAGVDDRTVAAAAAEHGVEAPPLAAYRARAAGRGGLVLGYSGYDEHAIARGVDALEPALRSAGRSGASVGSAARAVARPR